MAAIARITAQPGPAAWWRRLTRTYLPPTE
jgi:hypothetical protein